MADTSITEPTVDLTHPGTWQTVEQAAVTLGLSVRTVNRHISAQKLTSRLLEGRREVFVPRSVQSGEAVAINSGIAPLEPTSIGAPKPAEPPPVPPSSTRLDTGSENEPVAFDNPNSFLDLKTALAMADKMGDRQVDRQIELAVNAYRSLTVSLELQTKSAKRTASVAWCIVGFMSIGLTIALVWSATRVTRVESDSQHIKQQADEAGHRIADQEKQMTDMQQKWFEAQQQAARAEGRLAGYEEMRAHQAATEPTTRSIFDHLTSAFWP